MNIRIINSLKELQGVEEWLGFDVETFGRNTSPTVDCLATMQFYRESTDESLVYPVHVKGFNESSEELEVVKKVLPTLNVVGHYLQYDLTECLTHYGVMPNPVADTYLIACMLQWEHKGLKSIAAVFVPDSPTIPIETVVDVNDIEWDLSNPKQLEYMAGDPYKALKSYRAIEAKGSIKKLGKAPQIDIKALRNFCDSRARGMQVDMKVYYDMVERIGQEVADLDSKFQSLIPRPCKAGSPKDLQRLLFLDLGLEETPVKTSTGAPSTNEEALNYLIGKHPCIEPLLELKHKNSVQSGSKKLPQFLEDGDRLHPEFRQIGEDGTSRVYTSRPSANQYPKELRDAIVPDKGKKFLYFDWSAAELVLAAYWAGCVELLEAYEKGDLHSYVASRILKKDEISKEERNKVKVVVFSTLFGSEGDAAARRLMISREEAMGYVQDFFTQFPEIADLKAKVEETCKRTTYTRTIYGRPRRLPGVLSRSEQTQKHALRQAFNTAIQGSVADMMKIAVGRAYDYKDKGFEFVIGVFDSLMFQVPEEMTESEFLPVIDKLSTFGNLKLKYKWATGYSWKQVQDKT